MAKRQPTDARITITDTPQWLRIVMPCRRSWFVILFLVFWLCGWAVAEVIVANQLLNGDAPPEGEFFMLTWFGVWTVSGLLAIYALLWQVMGKEIKDYFSERMRNSNGQEETLGVEIIFTGFVDHSQETMLESGGIMNT